MGVSQHLKLPAGASLWLVPPQPHHLLPHGDKSNSHGLHIPHPHLQGHAKRHSQDLSTPKDHSRQSPKDLSKSLHQHNIYETLTELISTIPSTIPDSTASKPLSFVPHITLTSGIDLAALQPSPKAVLERIAIPEPDNVIVSFTSLEIGPTFTKKLFLRCDRAGLQGLAELARWQAVEATKDVSNANDIGAEDARRRAEEWAESSFDPHVSLLYSGAQVSEEQKTDVQNEITKAGITFNGTGDLGGWTGGSIWLVDTSLPITEWKPIAERNLKLGTDTQDL
ncbi:hypothetical protein FKW77_005708 [Venturia effusa]|uniref:2',3'-cyclic-nucleotide 3'-phosphodiesterase n=1 Tax=Venturia effusa TaxID=50376 RepID=A0A517LP35_9PEZI|nr:hypothetical protein FKW77_005708 [Venturia effusa]